MSANTNVSADWVGSARTNLLAWWLPHAAIVAGLFAAVSVRTAIWTVALAWMGVACILNAQRCGRTHCRYTGSYYLVMIAPVLVLGVGVVSAEIYWWIALGVLIVAGSKLIWWATERAWGKFLKLACLAALPLVGHALLAGMRLRPEPHSVSALRVTIVAGTSGLRRCSARSALLSGVGPSGHAP